MRLRWKTAQQQQKQSNNNKSKSKRKKNEKKMTNKQNNITVKETTKVKNLRYNPSRQGCCLTGPRVPGAPKLWVRATKVFFKEPEWAPKHEVFIPIQSVRWLQSSQEIDQKNHSHNKLKRKQLPLWSCLAFITRHIDQNTATKSLYAHKTAEIATDENHPIMHCKLSMYIMYANRLCLCWYLTDSSCKMATLITNIFGIGAINAADVILI